MHQLRHFQTVAINHAVASLQAGKRTLYAGPTGCGKSLVMLGVQQQLDNCWIVTPRTEIIVGLLDKLGINTAGLSKTFIGTLARKHQIATPITLRRRLMEGWGEPSYLLIDEAHHHNAGTYHDIDTLCGMCPTAAYTATPYRGTPRGTATFLKHWGDPLWMITLSEAVQLGYLSFPKCRIEPLVDDDKITVVNGEFQIDAINQATCSRLDAAASLLGSWVLDDTWDTPTLVSVPTREVAHQLQSFAEHTVVVTGDTPYAQRQQAFKDCLDCRLAIIQINVVSEGVDLPIRRLLDLSPTLSPVKWLQQFGRITRPGGAAEYVCTNRNLLRHAYLLEGMIPAHEFAEAQSKFETGIATRNNLRVLGLEALGRLKPAELPFANGVKGQLYNIYAADGASIRSYTALVHPLREEVIWATRTDTRKEDGTRAYGKWQRCEAPNDLSGFASATPRSVSDKQAAWWQRSAAGMGLDPNAKVTAKNFQVLPLLMDLRIRL